jgi:hypothetical protein
MRFVSYREAEYYCAQLARQLKVYLDPEVKNCRFVAIPRSGFIVLGMLSYILALEQRQVVCWMSDDKAEPTVVVDDCSLSGARFAATLEQIDTERVIFAHLFSHPGLRQAILSSEPRVEACLAAGDLDERTDFVPPDREAFETTWRERLPGRRYWLGTVEPVAFAWSQPDHVLWNERTGQLEDHWHWASPRRCLSTRVALGMPLAATPAGPITVPPHVQWKHEHDEVVLWHSQRDQVYGLKGVADAMWRALAAYGDSNAAVEHLLTQYDVSETELRSDLTLFTEELLDKGLLEYIDEQSETGCCDED